MLSRLKPPEVSIKWRKAKRPDQSAGTSSEVKMLSEQQLQKRNQELTEKLNQLFLRNARDPQLRAYLFKLKQEFIQVRKEMKSRGISPESIYGVGRDLTWLELMDGVPKLGIHLLGDFYPPDFDYNITPEVFCDLTINSYVTNLETWRFTDPESDFHKFASRLTTEEIRDYASRLVQYNTSRLELPLKSFVEVINDSGRKLRHESHTRARTSPVFQQHYTVIWKLHQLDAILRQRVSSH